MRHTIDAAKATLPSHGRLAMATDELLRTKEEMLDIILTKGWNAPEFGALYKRVLALSLVLGRSPRSEVESMQALVSGGTKSLGETSGGNEEVKERALRLNKKIG